MSVSGENRFCIQLKHKKCCVIKQTQKQISNLAERTYDKENRELVTSGDGAGVSQNRFSKYWRFIKKNQCCISMILFILFMAWFCIMIGVLIGATACSNLKIVSPLVHLKIPGLSWGCESIDDKCWKVF